MVIELSELCSPLAIELFIWLQDNLELFILELFILELIILALLNAAVLMSHNL